MTNEEESGIIKLDGGPGSGNFGHEGRPGEVGGSSSSESTKQKEANNSSGYPKRRKDKGASFQTIKDLIQKEFLVKN